MRCKGGGADPSVELIDGAGGSQPACPISAGQRVCAWWPDSVGAVVVCGAGAGTQGFAGRGSSWWIHWLSVEPRLRLGRSRAWLEEAAPRGLRGRALCETSSWGQAASMGLCMLFLGFKEWNLPVAAVSLLV